MPQPSEIHREQTTERYSHGPKPEFVDPLEQIENEYEPIEVDLLAFMHSHFWQAYLPHEKNGPSPSERLTNEILTKIVSFQHQYDENSPIEAINLTGSIALAIATGEYNPRHWQIAQYSKHTAPRTTGDDTNVAINEFYETSSDDAPADMDLVIRSDTETALRDLVYQRLVHETGWNQSSVIIANKEGAVFTNHVERDYGEFVVHIYFGPVKSIPDIETMCVSIFKPDPIAKTLQTDYETNPFPKRLAHNNKVYRRVMRIDISRGPNTGYEGITEKRTGGRTSLLQDIVQATLHLSGEAENNPTIIAHMTREAVAQARRKRDAVNTENKSANALSEILVRTLFKNLSRMKTAWSDETLTPFLTLENIFQIRRRVQELILNDEVWFEPEILKMLKTYTYLNAIMGQETAQFFLDTQLGEITITPGLPLDTWIELLHSHAFSKNIGGVTPSRHQRDSDLILNSRYEYRHSPRMDGFFNFMAAFQDVFQFSSDQPGHLVLFYLDLWRAINQEPPIRITMGVDSPDRSLLQAVDRTTAVGTGGDVFGMFSRTDRRQPNDAQIDIYARALLNRNDPPSVSQVKRIRENLFATQEAARGRVIQHLAELGHFDLGVQLLPNFNDLVLIYSLFHRFPSGLTAKEAQDWYNTLKPSEGALKIEVAILLVKLLGLVTAHDRFAYTKQNEYKRITFYSPHGENKPLEPLSDLITKDKYNNWKFIFHDLLTRSVHKFSTKPTLAKNAGDQYQNKVPIRPTIADVAENAVRHLHSVGITNLNALHSLRLEEDFPLMEKYLYTYKLGLEDSKDTYLYIQLMREAYLRTLETI